MTINPLNPVVAALPYIKAGSQASARQVEEESQLSSESGRNANEKRRVESVSQTSDIGGERRRGRDRRAVLTQSVVNPALFMKKVDSAPRQMPGPQILAELINQMSGAEQNSGPAQIVNIAV